MESIVSFRNRVAERTGTNLKNIPIGCQEDIQQGQILCRRGDIIVVTSGYPENIDGEEIYREFLVVDLNDECEEVELVTHPPSSLSPGHYPSGTSNTFSISGFLSRLRSGGRVYQNEIRGLGLEDSPNAAAAYKEYQILVGKTPSPYPFHPKRECDTTEKDYPHPSQG